MYRDCYIRFGCNDYDPKTPKNLFSHLTNNSINKKCIERADNKRALHKIPGNMWFLEQFRQHLNKKARESSPRAQSPAGENSKFAVDEDAIEAHVATEHFQGFLSTFGEGVKERVEEVG